MGMADDIGAMRFHEERGTLSEYMRGENTERATSEEVVNRHPIDRTTELLRRLEE